MRLNSSRCIHKNLDSIFDRWLRPSGSFITMVPLRIAGAQTLGWQLLIAASTLLVETQILFLSPRHSQLGLSICLALTRVADTNLRAFERVPIERFDASFRSEFVHILDTSIASSSSWLVKLDCVRPLVLEALFVASLVPNRRLG